MFHLPLSVLFGVAVVWFRGRFAIFQRANDPRSHANQARSRSTWPM